jgi:hypothetical protein
MSTYEEALEGQKAKPEDGDGRDAPKPHMTLQEVESAALTQALAGAAEENPTQRARHVNAAIVLQARAAGMRKVAS